MTVWWHHRTAVCDELTAELERAVPLEVAARACCCVAKPVVMVVMPPTASRPYPVDLLLCGHHFRVSKASLQAAGTAVYDKNGLLIMAGAKPTVAPGAAANRSRRTNASTAPSIWGLPHPENGTSKPAAGPGALCELPSPVMGRVLSPYRDGSQLWRLLV